MSVLGEQLTIDSVPVPDHTDLKHGREYMLSVRGREERSEGIPTRSERKGGLTLQAPAPISILIPLDDELSIPDIEP